MAVRDILSVDGRSVDPAMNLTRGEFVKMLVSSFSLLNTSARCEFTDVREDNPYYGYIASAKSLGIVSGYTDRSFGWNDEVSRQQMAALTYRTIQAINADIQVDITHTQFTDRDQISGYALEAVDALIKMGIINGVGNNRFAPRCKITLAQAAVIIYNLLDKVY